MGGGREIEKQGEVPPVPGQPRSAACACACARARPSPCHRRQASNPGSLRFGPKQALQGLSWALCSVHSPFLSTFPSMPSVPSSPSARLFLGFRLSKWHPCPPAARTRNLGRVLTLPSIYPASHQFWPILSPKLSPVNDLHPHDPAPVQATVLSSLRDP